MKAGKSEPTKALAKKAPKKKDAMGAALTKLARFARLADELAGEIRGILAAPAALRAPAPKSKKAKATTTPRKKAAQK